MNLLLAATCAFVAFVVFGKFLGILAIPLSLAAFIAAYTYFSSK